MIDFLKDLFCSGFLKDFLCKFFKDIFHDFLCIVGFMAIIVIVGFIFYFIGSLFSPIVSIIMMIFGFIFGVLVAVKIMNEFNIELRI